MYSVGWKGLPLSQCLDLSDSKEAEKVAEEASGNRSY